MCGIFGYFCRNKVDTKKVLQLLQILEEHRYKDQGEMTPVGGHGAGVSFLDDFGEMVVYKVGKKNASPTQDLSEIEEVAQASTCYILGHVRRASPNLIDTIRYDETAQPYKVACLGLSEIVSAHNGKVENYEQIRKDLSKEHVFQSEVVQLNDSEVIPHLFESLMQSNNVIDARNKTFERIDGNNTVVLLSTTRDSRLLHVLHKGHTRGMYVWKNDGGEIILCSREDPLRQVFGDLLKEGNFAKDLSIEWNEDRQEKRTYRIATSTCAHSTRCNTG